MEEIECCAPDLKNKHVIAQYNYGLSVKRFDVISPFVLIGALVVFGFFKTKAKKEKT